MDKIVRGLRKIAKHPRVVFEYLNAFGWLKRLPDKKWVELMWWSRTGGKIDLENPKGFNEKIQWLKLYDRKSEYTILVDKYLVREYVKEKIGEKHLIPLIGVWNDPDEIDFNLLPNQFVLKCTHNSGLGMFMCKDKAKCDILVVKSDLKRALSTKNYYASREWAYKNVHPRIIGEKLIEDKDSAIWGGTLLDYKFYCFNGIPKFLYVGSNAFSDGIKGELKLSFFDLNWKPTPFYRNDHKPLAINVGQPERFDEMIQIARTLSDGIPFVRVDLYWVNNQILFSEMTFYPGGGYGLFYPKEWELKLGDMITLPEKNRSKSLEMN